MVDQLKFLGCGPYSFQVEEGECLGISGKSGVGKTQLLRAISDLIPSTGQVVLMGQPKDEYPPTRWRELVTMLPADSVWWFDDVGAHFVGEKERFFAGTMCEALDFTSSVFSWQVSRLSSGERQRLAIVRSLQKRPLVLLLDEPTSALDPENVSRVEKVLLSLKREQNLTLIWVSHDPLQLKRVCDRVLCMTQDRLSKSCF